MGVTQRCYLLLLTEYRKHIWAVVREICELNKHLLLVIVMLNEFFLISVFIILKKGFKGRGAALQVPQYIPLTRPIYEP